MNHTTTMTVVTTDAAGAEVFRASKALPTDLDPKFHFGSAVAAAEAVLSDVHRHCFPDPTADDVDQVEGAPAPSTARVETFAKETDPSNE